MAGTWLVREARRVAAILAVTTRLSTARSNHSRQNKKKLMKSIVSRIAVLAAVTLALSACSGSDGDEPSDDDSLEDIPALDMSAEAEPDPEGGAEMLDGLEPTPIGDPDAVDDSGLTGLLIPSVFETATSVDLAYAQAGALLIEQLNDSLLLPADIDVAFADCGTANAFFIPGISLTSEAGTDSAGSIVMCHELTELFSVFYDTPEQGFLASTFVLMHELGHALVDVLELPVVGIEESFVDAVAAVFLGESNLSEGSVLAGFFFGAQGGTPFFDTHRAGPQRLGDLVCWGVGADASLLEDPFITDIAAQLVEGGRNCVAEYQQQVSGLAALLDGNILGGLNVLESPQ